MLPLYCLEVSDSPAGIGPTLPHHRRVIEAFDYLRAALLPGGSSPEAIQPELLGLFLQERLARAYRLLTVEIARALPLRWLGAYARQELEQGRREVPVIPSAEVLAEAARITSALFSHLPGIREVLLTDITAAYNGDPAAMSYAEVMLTYPGVHAIASHRIAHELYQLDVPVVPRIISEYTHAQVGVDIHPGAKIGASFFIDHATGVVIGETSEVGDRVKLYQGVTLGARSFPLDEAGFPQKKMRRHPRLEDDVIVYSNASILGPITVGAGSEVLANVMLTSSRPP
ncbi:MAG: serine acetyltransferase, partial [Armatimonadetes bacterium]|nr:serine acetyltransferase [Armatimonadota bacterium]